MFRGWAIVVGFAVAACTTTPATTPTPPTTEKPSASLPAGTASASPLVTATASPSPLPTASPVQPATIEPQGPTPTPAAGTDCAEIATATPDPATGYLPYRLAELEEHFPATVDGVPTAHVESMPWWVLVCQHQSQAALDQLRLDRDWIMELQYGSATATVGGRPITIAALRRGTGGAPPEILIGELDRLSESVGGTFTLADQTTVEGSGLRKITSGDGSVGYAYGSNLVLFLLGDANEDEATTIADAIAGLIPEPPAASLPLVVEQQFCSLEQGRDGFVQQLTALQSSASAGDWEAAQAPALELANWSASWRALAGEPLVSFGQTSALAGQVSAALDELDVQVSDVLSYSPVMMRPPPSQEGIAAAISSAQSAIEAIGALIAQTPDLACGVGIV